MPIVTIIIGALLDLIGFAGFFATNQESYTALIPSALGTLLIVFGALSLAKPGMRKHFMHAAAVVGLLGLLGSARGLFSLPALLSGAELERPVAVAAQSATAALCAIFLALCVRSFIAARRGQTTTKSIEVG